MRCWLHIAVVVEGESLMLSGFRVRRQRSHHFGDMQMCRTSEADGIARTYCADESVIPTAEMFEPVFLDILKWNRTCDRLVPQQRNQHRGSLFLLEICFQSRRFWFVNRCEIKKVTMSQRYFLSLVWCSTLSLSLAGEYTNSTWWLIFHKTFPSSYYKLEIFCFHLLSLVAFWLVKNCYR